jgi:hypothetical protein
MSKEVKTKFKLQSQATEQQGSGEVEESDFIHTYSNFYFILNLFTTQTILTISAID